MFELDSVLLRDTAEIGRFPLSLVLLCKDSRYPWCMLVPQRQAITEIHQLNQKDRVQLMTESCLLSEAMEQCFKPDSMNVAALGNLVSQLHVHHVARFTNDNAWPGPIWGQFAANDYSDELLDERLTIIRQCLFKQSQEFTV